MSYAALGAMVWWHPLAYMAAKTAAPIGAAHTFLARARSISDMGIPLCGHCGPHWGMENANIRKPRISV
jgi:hypothetical protein